MKIVDFKNKLDSRDLWGVHNVELYDAAHKWAETANEKSNINSKWSWDVGFKLDLDGDICNISSRFYPPHKSHESYGKYHGSISLYVLGEQIENIEIEAKNLDEIQKTAESEVKDLETKLAKHMKLFKL